MGNDEVGNAVWGLPAFFFFCGRRKEYTFFIKTIYKESAYVPTNHNY